MTERRQSCAGKDVDMKALAVPLVMITALVGFIAVFTKWGIAVAVGFWSVLVIALLLWSWGQFRRARREIRSEVERSGCKVVRMKYRHLRLGPFSMLDTSRSQLVYRVVARDGTGRERVVWARRGRKWFWNPDALELRWEGNARHAERWSEPQ
ncbi:MAG TPA: hypothetical protein VMG82_38330 [Candidatus Sulfotelmatobacter sp.]|nr:hypothetical protein [Candidatus Sulfotelmatobacter sp.]